MRDRRGNGPRRHQLPDEPPPPELPPPPENPPLLPPDDQLPPELDPLLIEKPPIDVEPFFFMAVFAFAYQSV